MNTFAHAPATIRIGSKEVSRVGFGAMQLPGPMVWGEPRDPDAARAVLRRVVECGIRLIDTSWYYGPHVANRLIAETLYPYPKDLVLATKLGGARTPDKGWVAAISPEALRKGCEEDLRGLRLERCEYVHLRYIESDVPFLESLDAMIALRAQGKIGHIALSNVTLAQLEQAMARTPIAGVQNLYNVVLGERTLAGIPHMVVQDQETHRRPVRSERHGVPAVLSAGAAGRRTTGVDRADRDRGASRCIASAGRHRVAARAFAGDGADSRHQFGRASRRELGRARTRALGRRDRDDHERSRVASARLLTAREVFLQRTRAAHAAIHRNERERQRDHQRPAQ